MPIYFNDIAPFCPTSRDHPIGPMNAPNIRTTIPIARDLQSAIAAVNIARTIITQIVTDRIINNTYGTGGSTPSKPDQFIDKSRKSRWSEQSSKRIKRKYKYYGKGSDGGKDKDTWVMTERIERMVWYDRVWKTYLTFEYGDKGDDAEALGTVGTGSDAGGET